MNVIIIEDDENKRTQLKAFVENKVPGSNVVVTKSLQSGLKEILKETYNLILLDMTMPTFDIDSSIDEDGGRTQPLAGRALLYQMERRGIEIPVIVVTQFDRFGAGKDSLTLGELDQQLRQTHPRIYIGFVYYNTALEGWKNSLNKLIRTAMKSRGRKDNV